MKLIRLTTTDQNANFNSTFNEDIIIEPFSKIALHSLTTQIETSQIVIDAQNNEIVFEIAGIARTIALNHGVYDKTNIDDLFSDFTDKLNACLGYRQSELGKQFLVSTSKNNFVVQLKTGMVVDAVRDLIAGATNQLIGSRFVKQNLGGGATPKPINIQRDGGTDTTMDSFVYIKSPITKGCGSARARIYSSVNTANGGYMIALLTEPVNVNTTVIDPTKIALGIRFVDLTQPYKIIKNGVETATTISPILSNNSAPSSFGGASNDQITLNLYGDRLYAMVVNNSPDAPAPAPPVYSRTNGLLIDSIAYTPGTNLFPVLVMISSQTKIELFDVSTDPFYNSANNAVVDIEDHTFGAIPSFINSDNNTVLTFKDADLSKILGFINPRIPPLPTPFLKTVNGSSEYKATYPLVFRDIADTYIVEMMNLNIDAYDDIKQQHMNILSVIPQWDAVRERLVYSATYPVFLSLNNPYRINLRELRCRILKEDLTGIETSGYSQITILIQN